MTFSVTFKSSSVSIRNHEGRAPGWLRWKSVRFWSQDHALEPMLDVEIS